MVRHRLTCLAIALACTLGIQLHAQQDDLQGERSTQEQERQFKYRAEGLDQSAPPSGELRDAERLQWLAQEFEAAARLSEFAANRIEDRELADFAEKNALSMENLAKQLKQTEAVVAAVAVRKRAMTAPDLSETVEDIGKVVRERLEQRAERRDAEKASRPPEQSGEAEEVRRARDGRTRQRSGEARDDRRLDNVVAEDAVLEVEPRDAAERTRRGEGQTARDRIRVLLPALREELPEVLSIVAEELEDEGGGKSDAWLHQQREIAERVLQAKQRELNRHEGEAFDQAYLGMVLDRSLELQAAAEVIGDKLDNRESAAADISETLHMAVDESRRLMDEQTERYARAPRREESRDEGPR